MRPSWTAASYPPRLISALPVSVCHTPRFEIARTDPDRLFEIRYRLLIMAQEFLPDGHRPVGPGITGIGAKRCFSLGNDLVCRRGVVRFRFEHDQARLGIMRDGLVRIERKSLVSALHRPCIQIDILVEPAAGMELSRELGSGRTKVRRTRLEFRPQSLPASSATLPVWGCGACCGKQDCVER